MTRIPRRVTLPPSRRSPSKAGAGAVVLAPWGAPRKVPLTDQKMKDRSNGAEGDHRTMASELLSVAPFLSELSREELTGLADAVAVASYGVGEVVVEEGSPGESLFIVSKGILTVRTTGPEGNQVTVGTLTAGDFFGEISLLLGLPRTATVVAESDAICLEIGKEDWRYLQRLHPRLRAVLLEALQARAANSVEAVVEDYRRRKAGGRTGD